MGGRYPLVGHADGSSATLTNAQFVRAAAGAYTTSSSSRATEADAQDKWPLAGAITGLRFLNGTNNAGLMVRVNGANSALTTTIGTAGQSRIDEDVVQLAVDDLVCVTGTIGTTGTFNNHTLNFQASGNHAAIVAISNNAPTLSPNTTGYVSTLALAGRTESDSVFVVSTAGTLKKLRIHVPNNTLNVALRIRSRINGAYGTLDITVAAGTTGWFSDDVHTDSLAQGDTFCFEYSIPAGTGSASFGGTYAIEYASGVTADLFSGYTTENYSSANTWYRPIAGVADRSSVETNLLFKMGFRATLSQLRVRVTGNTWASGNLPVTLRVNGVDTALVATIGFGVTGIVADTTHSVVVNAGDKVSLKVDAAAWASGTVNIQAITVAVTDSEDPTVSSTTFTAIGMDSTPQVDGFEFDPLFYTTPPWFDSAALVLEQPDSQRFTAYGFDATWTWETDARDPLFYDTLANEGVTWILPLDNETSFGRFLSNWDGTPDERFPEWEPQAGHFWWDSSAEEDLVQGRFATNWDDMDDVGSQSVFFGDSWFVQDDAEETLQSVAWTDANPDGTIELFAHVEGQDYSGDTGRVVLSIPSFSAIIIV